jgi:hypothetical protein
MTKTKTRVFFYGSFINRQVLARAGLNLEQFEVARLWGFNIVIDTLATLARSDRHCVYGIACEVTHEELRALYAQDWLGGMYLPEAVVVETEGARLLPALCFISPDRLPARPDNHYLDWIITPARQYGFPDWYIEHLERFRG